MTRNQFFVILVAVLLIFQTVLGVPTTMATTGNYSGNATFWASGATTPVMWQYGTRSDNLVWRTENASASGGLANVTESGLPLMAGQLFYYRACDSSGCGNTESTTLLAVTPAPTSTFGAEAQNISKSHMDPLVVAGSSSVAYTWSMGTIEIVVAVLLFFVFIGLWLRQREVLLPTLLGLIGSGLLFVQGTNSVGMPPEFLLVTVSIVALGLAGVVVGMMKR